MVWLGLGKPLEDDGYHRIYDRNGENYLEIPRISILDAGEYSCVATNMMGAVYSTFTICVEGRIRLPNPIKTKMMSPFLAMTEPESTSSEMEERSANVSDVDANAVCYLINLLLLSIQWYSMNHSENDLCLSESTVDGKNCDVYYHLLSHVLYFITINRFFSSCNMQ